MLYPVNNHALLSAKYRGLEDDDKRDAYQTLAEQLLGLVPPAYTDPADVAELTLAVVMQINFLFEQEVEAEVHESVSNSQPGIVTRFRNRWRSPRAWAIVERTTGVRAVRFEPYGRGT